MEKGMKSFILIILFFIIGCNQTFSQWKQTNGPFGGTINCLFVNSGGVLFAGTISGIYRSLNNGENWSTNQNLLSGKEITCFVEKDNCLFVGTRLNGLFFSTDNGINWNEIKSDDLDNAITKLVFKDDKLFVGAHNAIYVSEDFGVTWKILKVGLNTKINSFVIKNDTIYAGTESTGMFKSTDNGTTWSGINFKLTHQNVSDITISGDDIIITSLGGGAYKSSDGGASWTQINNGLITSKVICLFNDNENIYAGSEGGYIYLLNKSSYKWSLINKGLSINNVNSILKHKNSLFAGIKKTGVYRSDDLGNLWTSKNHGINLPVINCIAVDGNNVLVNTDYGKLQLSTDNGSSWSVINIGEKNTAVLKILLKGNNIYVGTYMSALLYSTNLGKTWVQNNSGLNENILNLKMNNKNIYIHTYSYNLYKVSNSDGAWMSLNNSFDNKKIKGFDCTDDLTFVVLDNDSSFISTDDGNTWNISKQTFNKSYNYKVAIKDSIILVGTDNNNIYYSTDLGKWWESALYDVDGYSNAIAVNNNNLFTISVGDKFYYFDLFTKKMINKSSGLPAGQSFTMGLSDNFAFIGTPYGLYYRKISDLLSTSVNDDNGASSGFSVYPNPASDFIMIDPKVTDKVNIYNILGLDITPENISGKFDISKFQSGTYFIKIGNKIEKFVKL